MSSETTPEQIAQLKAEAKRLRRQRQTTKNLVASLIASLGVVVFLILVVVRPDAPVRTDVDYRTVAQQSSSSAQGDLIVPNLDDTWSSNRADLLERPEGQVWTIGLVSSTGDFVQLVQIFGDPSGAEVYLPDGGVDSEVTITGAGDTLHTWQARDRQEVEQPGNYLFILSRPTPSGAVVIRGTSEPAVLFVASLVQQQHQELFGETS